MSAGSDSSGGPSAERSLQADQPDLERAVEVLGRGGLVVMPTDTVYGLAVVAASQGAGERLAAAKGRPSTQAVAVLVADVGQAAALADLSAVGGFLERAWPGPVTVIMPRLPAARRWALGGDPRAIGVRCPADDLVRSLAARAGPLATTSANRHGQPTPPTARAAAAALVQPPELVLDGGPRGGTASAVINATTEPWIIVRLGPFSEDSLLGLLAGS